MNEYQKTNVSFYLSNELLNSSMTHSFFLHICTRVHFIYKIFFFCLAAFIAIASSSPSFFYRILVLLSVQYYENFLFLVFKIDFCCFIKVTRLFFYTRGAHCMYFLEKMIYFLINKKIGLLLTSLLICQS